MWHYNGEDDASRYGRKGPNTPAALAKILAELYKGEKEEFSRLQYRDGLSMYDPPIWVRFGSTYFILSLDHSLTGSITTKKRHIRDILGRTKKKLSYI